MFQVRRTSGAAAGRATRLPRLLALAVAVCATAVTVPGIASSAVYKPPSKKIWSGVSDTGKLADYNNFVDRVGKHQPIMQTFHSWGTKLGGADNRWSAARVRPMLHISTREGGGPEEISPGGIARGQGDDYLIHLNRYFGGEKKRTAYIRPFGEMNGAHNPYSAFNGNGRRRDANHSTTQFKRAWKRIVIIVSGGGTPDQINARLAAQRLPPLQPKTEILPPYFSQAPVSFVWTPQLRSWPNVKGNSASRYWPGKRWVDWTGTDIFSNSASFAALNSFYRKQRRGKPFVIGEYSVALGDNPRFVKSLLGWAKSHKAVRMVVYYQGYGNDAYRPWRHPKSMGQLRKHLRTGRFPAYTPENA